MHASPSRPLPRYKFILFVVCIALLIGNAASLYRNLAALRAANTAIEASWDIKARLQSLNLLIADAESGSRGYALSGNAVHLGPLHTAQMRSGVEFAQLRTALRERPGQLKNLAQLQVLVASKLAALERNVALYRARGLDAIVDSARGGDGRDLLDEIRFLVVVMAGEESEVARARGAAFYGDYLRAVMLGTGINLLAIAVLALFYRSIRRSFSELSGAERKLHDTNATLEQAVAVRTTELSVLSQHLLHVAEEEKAGLARELHDELGASLTAIGMDIGSVAARLKGRDPALERQLARARDTLLRTIAIKRHIVESLRPSMLDHLGLLAALTNYCENYGEISGLACQIDLPEALSAEPASGRAIALFRILQEALNNVAKYAQAGKVLVRLREERGGLRLLVEDDGVGIAQEAMEAPMSHGVLGMRERAVLAGGTFALSRGADGRGTAVEAWVPFD
ncbi:MAG TPA: CHASE3 domain-containing protein [Burkholderiaceae bacterium]